MKPDPNDTVEMALDEMTETRPLIRTGQGQYSRDVREEDVPTTWTLILAVVCAVMGAMVGWLVGWGLF